MLCVLISRYNEVDSVADNNPSNSCQFPLFVQTSTSKVPSSEVTDVSRKASRGCVIKFASYLIHHHNCTPGPFATYLKTAEEELVRAVADRGWLPASLASMTDKFNSAMEQVVAKTCQGATFQRRLTAYQKQNAAYAHQAEDVVLRAQVAEARAAEAEAHAARAEGKAAALKANVAAMDASSSADSY